MDGDTRLDGPNGGERIGDTANVEIESMDADLGERGGARDAGDTEDDDTSTQSDRADAGPVQPRDGWVDLRCWEDDVVRVGRLDLQGTTVVIETSEDPHAERWTTVWRSEDVPVHENSSGIQESRAASTIDSEEA